MLGLAVAVAGGVLLSSDRASAQEAPQSQVRNSSPPTVSATADYPNAEVSWDFDAGAITPAGWELETFQVTREDYPVSGNLNVFADQSAETRSLTDSLSIKTKDDWLAGFRVRYNVRALFVNKTSKVRQSGQEGTFILVVPASAPLNEVRQAGQPSLNAYAQHPSVELPWTLNAETSTPRGWKLYGFQLSSADYPSNANLRTLPDQSADARSFTDKPNQTTDQWLAGFRLRYNVRPVFQRVIDDVLQPGAERTIIFTVPATAPPSAVQSSAAPTVSASASYPNVQVRWTYDPRPNTPVGWKLTGFQVWRESATPSAEQGGLGSLNDPENAIFPVQAATARSYTDTADHKSRYDWLEGFNQRYAVRPVFERDIDDAIEVGQRATYTVVAKPPVPPQEVMASYPAPTLTAVTHADGVQLNWTFDEESSTPRGWKLGGFVVSRWIGVGRDGNKLFFKGPPYRATTDRSFKDSLSRTLDEHRFPGAKIQFAIGAIWLRVIDGDRRFAQKTEITFTAPKMPNVRNFRLRWGEQTANPQTWGNELVWDRPHLAWSNRFPRVTGYTIYQGGETFASLDGEVFSHSWFTNTLCDDADKLAIRAQYGLFFSGLISPVDQRWVDGYPCTDL